MQQGQQQPAHVLGHPTELVEGNTAALLAAAGESIMRACVCWACTPVHRLQQPYITLYLLPVTAAVAHMFAFPLLLLPTA